MTPLAFVASVCALSLCLSAAGPPAKLSSTQTNGVSCAAGSVYVISQSGELSRWLLLNGIMTLDTILQDSSDVSSLAIAHDMYEANRVRTFYGTAHPNDGYGEIPYRWNGKEWVKGEACPEPVPNAGGNGEYLYFTGLRGGLNRDIIRYTKNSRKLIYASPEGRDLAVADLAVDSKGNVYFLTGESGTMSDSLMVISPEGNFLLKVPLSVDCNHAYGSFLMNGVFYIGFGDSNPDQPNSLLPIFIGESSAVAGPPIPFVDMDYADLASCDPGNNLSFVSPGNADEKSWVSASPARRTR